MIWNGLVFFSSLVYKTNLIITLILSITGCFIFSFSAYLHVLVPNLSPLFSGEERAVWLDEDMFLLANVPFSWVSKTVKCHTKFIVWDLPNLKNRLGESGNRRVKDA